MSRLAPEASEALLAAGLRLDGDGPEAWLGVRRVHVEVIAAPEASPLLRAVERLGLAYAEGASRLEPILRSGVLAPGLAYLARAVPRGPLASAYEYGDALRIVLHVAEALEQLHARGAVHAALERASLRIDGTGDGLEARVGAPALAQLADIVAEQQSAGLGRAQIERRARYLAPELIRGKRPDPRADVYALGVLAYELILGAAPFDGARPDDVLAMHLAEEPPRPSARRAALPRELDYLLCQLIAKDPSARPEPRVAQQLLRLVALDEPPPPSAWRRWIGGLLGR